MSEKIKIYDYIPDGVIMVSKLFLTELIEKLWNECPNCGNSITSWTYIQSKPPTKDNFQIGYKDEIVCPKCGYKEDITCYNCW